MNIFRSLFARDRKLTPDQKRIRDLEAENRRLRMAEVVPIFGTLHLSCYFDPSYCSVIDPTGCQPEDQKLFRHSPPVSTTCFPRLLACPRLPRIAYIGDTLDVQLESSMREFANLKSNVRVDGGKHYLSSIFDWFADDFVFFELQAAGRNDDKAGSGKNVSNRQELLITYINRFRTLADRLDRNLIIEFVEYNKKINKQYVGVPGTDFNSFIQQPANSLSNDERETVNHCPNSNFYPVIFQQ